MKKSKKITILCEYLQGLQDSVDFCENKRCDSVIKMIDVLTSCKTVDQVTNTLIWIDKVSVSHLEYKSIVENVILINMLQRLKG